MVTDAERMQYDYQHYMYQRGTSSSEYCCIVARARMLRSLEGAVTGMGVKAIRKWSSFLVEAGYEVDTRMTGRYLLSTLSSARVL